MPGTGWTQTGVASWYGDPFHGRRTASGEVYDMDELTAAHQTLAFGTVIDVANLDNGRSVELRVTDRGPFAKNRILDVSRAGARALDMMGPGTANIRITIVNPGGDPVAVRGGCVVVQFAAYRDRASATERAREAGALGFRASVEESDGWYRAIAGPFDSSESARDATETLGGFLRRCGPD
jgi:rare lipoprotein A